MKIPVRYNLDRMSGVQQLSWEGFEWPSTVPGVHLLWCMYQEVSDLLNQYVWSLQRQRTEELSIGVNGYNACSDKTIRRLILTLSFVDHDLPSKSSLMFLVHSSTMSSVISIILHLRKRIPYTLCFSNIWSRKALLLSWRVVKRLAFSNKGFNCSALCSKINRFLS